MKVKLNINYNDGTPAVQVTTNLYVICEWEKLENRKVADGKGIGYSDLACWAWLIFQARGDDVGTDWRKWVKKNPNIDISAVEESNPNPTALAPTEGS